MLDKIVLLIQQTPYFKAILAVDEHNEMISVGADDSCSRSSEGDHVHVVRGGLENISEKRGGSLKIQFLEGACRKTDSIVFLQTPPPQPPGDK